MVSEQIDIDHEYALFYNSDYFDCGDPESLRHTSVEEAIEDYVDQCGPCDDGRLPRRVSVTGYKRGVVAPGDLDPEWELDQLLERLDEEYNCGDEPTEATPKMRAAAAEFMRVMRAEYQPWNCDEVGRRDFLVTYDSDGYVQDIEEAPRG